MTRIKVALVGVGNCASALVQGLKYYAKRKPDRVGMTHEVLAGYSAGDVQVVSAIDIDARKVGKDLAEAVFAPPNVLGRVVDLKPTGVLVEMGKVLDGVIEEVGEEVQVSGEQTTDVGATFAKADMVVCLLPSGAKQAVNYYAGKALEVGTAFINATPCALATDPEWASKFEAAGVPLVGDDLQDQIGSTIIQKLLLREMDQRGVRIKESYSLDVGGGVDSLNSLFRARDQKREIKSKSVQSALEYDAPIISGTTDYVPHLKNGRDTHVWIVGNFFLGQELKIDMKIQSTDGPNGGAILLDVIRATKIALQEGAGGPLRSISAYGFKNPPGGSVFPRKARDRLADFVLGKSHT
ncbi:MAG: inositol-3-phosphate synthase [Promethearchaeota archaeon]